MATLAELTAAQQLTVDGEAAALKAALENIIVLEMLKHHSVGEIRDLEAPLEVAVGMSFATFLLQTRAAGHTLYESQTES